MPLSNPETAKPDPFTSRAGKRWKPEEDSQLIDMFLGKASFAQLATMFGRTQGAITSRLEAKGYIIAHGEGWLRAQPNRTVPDGERHGQSWTPEEKNAVATLFLQGMDIYEVSSTLQRKPTSCANRLVEQGYLVNYSGVYHIIELTPPTTLPNDWEIIKSMVLLNGRYHVVQKKAWCNLRPVIPTGDPEVLF